MFLNQVYPGDYMEGNAYLFKNTSTGKYCCHRSGEILDDNDVPLMHMNYSSIDKLVEDIKLMEEEGAFPTPYFFVSGLPKEEGCFMVNGGRKHFEPATDKEIKKIMRGLGRKEYMPNLVSLPYEKNQRRKEQYIPLLDEQLDDQLVDEFLSFLMRGDFPHLVEVPNCGKDDEDN